MTNTFTNTSASRGQIILKFRQHLAKLWTSAVAPVFPSATGTGKTSRSRIEVRQIMFDTDLDL